MHLVTYAAIPIFYPKEMEHMIENVEGIDTFSGLSGNLIGTGLYALGGYVLPFIALAGVSIIILIPLSISINFKVDSFNSNCYNYHYNFFMFSL